jgi:hypothetical protein
MIETCCGINIGRGEEGKKKIAALDGPIIALLINNIVTVWREES